MNVLALLFDHILEGRDIPRCQTILRIGLPAATSIGTESPYSIITNLAHTVLWQEQWLARLKGEPLKSVPDLWRDDFRLPDPIEWEDLRSRLAAGLNEARGFAARDPLDHHCESDEVAVDLLIRIAIRSLSLGSNEPA